ncbi:hypothetical protein D3C81_1947810 [compost metagenome]
MLGRQRANQRVVLTRHLRGRELNAVRHKAHLSALLRDKISHLHQLLSEDLRRRDQRLHGVGWLGHDFVEHLVKDRFQVIALFQRRMRRIRLHFSVSQLLA